MRPTKYDPKFCEALIEHMKQGLSYTTFAAVADVHPDTLYEWEKKHPEFSEAKKKAFIHCQLEWEKAGSIDSLEKKDMSWTGWYMNMKNRFGWRDKVEQDTSIEVQVIVDGKKAED